MKSKLIISAILFALIIQVNAQTIPNSGFENWTMQPGGYEDPDNWTTNNVTSGVSVSKITDSHSGNYALQVINNYPWIEGPLTGYATFTIVDSNVVDKISAYVKCDSISGFGKGIISVAGYTGSTWQYIGNWETTSAIPQYVHIDIQLTPLIHFDSIAIYLASLGTHDSLGQSTGYAALKVDDINVETISDVSEVNPTQIFSVAPNPVLNTAMILFDYPTDENCLVTVYNQIGKLVQTIEGASNSPIYIQRNNLLDGIYYFQVHSESAFIGAGKFVLQKAD